MKKVIEGLVLFLDKTFKGFMGKVFLGFIILWIVGVIVALFGAGQTEDFWYWFLLISFSITVGLPVIFVFIRQLIVRPDK